MSLLSKSLKSTAVMSISNYITLVASIAAFLFLVWALTPEQYGIYILILSFVNFSARITDLGTSKLIITELAKHIKSKDLGFVKKFLGRHFVVQFGLGLFFMFAFLFLSDLFLGEEMGIQHIALAGGLVILTKIMLRTERQMFLVQTRFREISILDGGGAILRLAILLALVHYMGMGIEGAIFSFALSNLLVFLLFLSPSLSFIKKVWKHKEVRDDVYLNSMWSKGKYLIAATQIKNLTDKAPLWLIAYFFGAVDVAVFSVAKRMLEPITKFVSSLETVALPLLSQLWVKNKEKAVQMYTSFAKVGLYVSLVLGVVAFFIVPTAVGYLFPGEYEESVPIFQILLLSTVVIGFASAQRAFLNVLDLQKIFIYAYFLGLVVFLVSFSVMVPIFGILSVPLSIILKGIAGAGYREWKIYKQGAMQGMRMRDLFLPNKRDWGVLNRIKKSLKSKFSKKWG